MLQSLQALDALHVDDPVEFQREFGRKRLGVNPTIQEQIRRYHDQVQRHRRVADDEALGVMRLCARRADARLLFDTAGRRAARTAAHTASTSRRVFWRLAPGRLRRRLGLALTRRVADDVFEIRIARDGSHMTGTPRVADRTTAATPDGAACGFYSSAIAELLRNFVDFDGAVIHERCAAKGNGPCRWHIQHP